MPILMKDTVYKEMFLVNQIVECDGNYGRVMAHDVVTHTVHVLLRLNNNTWRIKKIDDLHCYPAQVFLWTIENAFGIRRPRVNRTPQIMPIEVMILDDDCVMEL